MADVDVAIVIGPLALLVVGQRASDGRPIQSTVARIRELCPHVGIFLATEGDLVSYHRLAAYSRVGIDEVAELTDHLLLARFARMMQARLEAPPPEEALWHMSDLTQPSVARVSQWCIRNSYRRRRTDEVASRFGVDRSTLQRRCTDACGASPNELIRLGRLLHFEELRRTSSLTRQQIVMRASMNTDRPYHLILTIALVASGVLGCDLFTSSESDGPLRLCWRESQRPGFSWAQPAVTRDLVVFAEGDGSVTARDQRSGAVRWSTRVDTAGVLGFNMPVSGDIVVVPVARYTVGLDRNNGREVWRYEAPLDRRENPQSPRPGVVAANTVAADRGLVFVSAWGATVSALDGATGRVEWIWTPGDSVPFRSGAGGVAISGDTVYATVWHYVNPLGGSAEQWLVAIDRVTGRELWRLIFPSYTGGVTTTGAPVIFGDLAIFTTRGGYEFAVHRFSQRVVWTFTPETQHATFSQPRIHGDVVYHDGGDRYLYALRAVDGTRIWRAAIDGQPNVDFLVTPKHIYVSVDTKFVVLDRETGRRIAAIDQPGTTNGRFLTAAAFSEGRVFVTGNEAALCFVEPR